MVTQQF